MKILDDYLNKITMYRLVLYVLIFLWMVGGVWSLWGILPFDPISYLFTSAFIVAVCWVANTVFAQVFEAPTNLESVYITALILILLVQPIQIFDDIFFFGWISVLAIASKYILAVNKKHIFNPAAIAAVIVAIALGQSATWWVGSSSMLPFVFVSGALIVKKIRRVKMVTAFIVVALATMSILGTLKGTSPVTTIQRGVLDSPLIFFAFVMFTEPLTTPPTLDLRLMYAALVGFLFAPQLKVGSFYTTPEIALVLGNIFSYLVSPRHKLVISLSEKVKLSPNIYDFVFDLNQKIKFLPGQYMEWTLSHQKTDNRGSRRYLTIASSPTEGNIRIGVKFNNPSSSYKSELLNMKKGDKIVASQLSGDFTLPDDKSKKLVFIAGGIGVTPYRSMVKYLSDTGEKRDIVLFYACGNLDEFVYQDVFEEGAKKFGLKVHYVCSNKEIASKAGWKGLTGHVDMNIISQLVPDFKDRTFYISGPEGMVNAFKKSLKSLKVSGTQIKTDYFPGY